jgi:hypothetical protein
MQTAASSYRAPEPDSKGYRWWKGNLHAHSLWSDGDAYPEWVAAWYKENGYHFLALSDHNILSVGEKWIDPATHPQAARNGGLDGFEAYRDRFGDDWVETRQENGALMVRLKTLEELRPLFEEPGRFLMIPAEEISDHIHLNAINLAELIPPQRGATTREVIERNVAAVLEQRDRTGQPMIPHLNHPNWRWRLTAEEMAAVDALRFFEVYNAHRNSRNYGDETRASHERMWDIVLTLRLSEYNSGVMYGLASDDAHNYGNSNSDVSLPGRGWVRVRSRLLAPEQLVHALEAGEFYSSSGVAVRQIDAGGDRLSIEIEPEDGVSYVTEFVGTRSGFDPASEPVYDEEGNPVTRCYSADIGAVLATVEGLNPVYSFTGDELYVRARVISSKQKENYYEQGEKEKAWIQPVIPG